MTNLAFIIRFSRLHFQRQISHKSDLQVSDCLKDDEIEWLMLWFVFFLVYFF